MKKLVVFDLDGTLVDSIYDLADCVNTALRKHNLPENTLSEYYSFVGNGMENLIRTSLKSQGNNDELYKAVRADFDIEYAAHCNDKTCPYEGVAELLTQLEDKGIATAVLTNKADEFVGGILSRCFPEHKFSAFWGQRQGIERKPSAQGLLMLIQELGYKVEDCVYIGDSEVDVKTANNAGMDLVCVLWGFRSKDELISAGAKRMVSTAEELLQAIITL
ncbi:MAG: HAD-IA family hydrolase [Ruminococcus sp.]|nr:HAD-IA family hydrolase [Ruminococcus sp.]